MGLKPFFTFFGGKWRAAPHYPPPLHDVLVEPFAGAAGYAVRYPHLSVLVNDADPIIASLWDYLIHVSEDEIRHLPIDLEHVSEVPGPPEARSLVGFWLNKGSTGPRNVPSKWMRDDLRPNSYWGEVIRERIASQLQAIRHWKVRCGSYEDLVDRRATWFIDPPYRVSGVHYRYHDIDFDQLAAWCRSRSGQVLVCEQAGAAWLPFEPFREIKALEGGRGSKTSREVLWAAIS